MNRRELVEAFAAAGLIVTTGARAADPPTTEHEHHDHSAMGKYGDLVLATSRCVNSGETCIAHCLTLLGEGEKELAACAKTVQDVVASCTALRQLAAANSPHVAKLAGVVGDICSDCETECRKHEKKHSVCHECAEACAQCVRQCQNAANAA
jgi:Cys-rich four helix bundle protein (predicted Tat secretion target)